MLSAEEKDDDNTDDKRRCDRKCIAPDGEGAEMEQDGAHLKSSGNPRRFCHMQPLLMLREVHGFIKKVLYFKKKGKSS